MLKTVVDAGVPVLGFLAMFVVGMERMTPDFRWIARQRTSAPLKELQKKFGFTLERIVAVAKEQLVSS